MGVVTVRELVADDRAVSKVVGVVLMVAIVGMLAATTATMVMGFGDMLNDPAPQVNFAFEYDDDVVDGQSQYHESVHEDTTEVVVIEHQGGDRIDPKEVELVIRWVNSSGEIEEWRDTWANAATGQESPVTISGTVYGHVWGGSTTFSGKGSVKLIWQDPDADRGVVLDKWEAEG